MKAVISRDGRFLECADARVPEPGPGEVRIRVTACGICGSDLHLRGLGALRRGGVPGHEIAGVVDALGPGASGVRPGAAVVVEPLVTCGACRPCRTGRDSICPEMNLLGLQRDGGMAEFVVAPAARLFPLADAIDPRVGALAEPIAVAVHGLRRGGFEPGQRLLVIGAGSIGLVTLLCARALGARDVGITARHAHQAALAREFGATRVLAESEATSAALGEHSMRDGADLVIETVGGRAETLRLAAAALAPGGSISVLGLFTAPVTLDPFSMLLREATVAWSNCYARAGGRADFADAVAIVDRERERLARLVTHTHSFADVDRAFAAASDKRAGAIKVTLVPAAL